ncbi:alpha/beta fold hydrolase [Modicisalibacter luteus]|uniref:Alpha/beta fold hydrolase n=1 Tax=Modicisalibacter luteus TaxID=453962 RepID=A0ABV7M6D9_9GAMM|nr:alpha/beta hydrolase [Halomonas lutea]GHB08032.1 hypothetical protein GCM10007159_32610 [Halomonas lutea]
MSKCCGIPVEPWQGEEGKRAFFRNLRRLNREYALAIADELKQLPHETLVLWGRFDPFRKPAYTEQLKSTLPNFSIAWVDAAHWITEERPDEVAEIVGRFLETQRCQSARDGLVGPTSQDKLAAF